MSDSNRGFKDTPLGQGFAVIAAIILCCLIVGILSFSWGRASERDSERAIEYQKYADHRQSIFCAGLEGNLLAQCRIEQEQITKSVYQSERDLEAQRDMSLWALAVFIISALTAFLTLWALVYVRGTLVATREALEDTGQATRAMIRQNEISERSQRPWLAIRCIPAKLSVKRVGGAASVSVKIDIITANLGVMPAVYYQLRFKLIWSKQGDFADIERALKKFDPGTSKTRKTVIPKDEVLFSYWSNALLSESAFNSHGEVYGIFVVSAFYKIDSTSTEWCRTDSAYIIGWRSNGEVNSRIRAIDANFRADNLVLETMLSSTLAD
ncbi:hypothetical protein ABIE62_002231 [Porphyrobacter sp. MBR-155]|jgi:hypothetical protein|uniref:hypothetical protein n=1 Tax=Porphyrobacter sp. MBR-155 TaxID=3156464 RepID=UPI0033979882